MLLGHLHVASQCRRLPPLNATDNCRLSSALQHHATRYELLDARELAVLSGIRRIQLAITATLNFTRRLTPRIQSASCRVYWLSTVANRASPRSPHERLSPSPVTTPGTSHHRRNSTASTTLSCPQAHGLSLGQVLLRFSAVQVNVHKSNNMTTACTTS